MLLAGKDGGRKGLREGGRERERDQRERDSYTPVACSFKKLSSASSL